MQSAAIGSPKPCDSTPSASDLLSSTPATLRQPLLPDDLGTPAVPDTVIAGPTDVGYLLADSLTPKTAQSTALGAASVTTASPRQTLPNAVAPALGVTNAVGLLDAAYFSTEAGPEMIDAVNKSTEELFVASTSSPHKLAAPTEGKVQGVDTMVAMCLSEADAESAEDMGELSPFQHMCESPDSPHSSAVSGKDADDIGVPSDLMQSPLTLRQPSSPAVSVPHMPALDSSMASDAFGSPMQQVPASATRTARSSGTPYRVSPVCHDSHSVSDSAAGEDGTPLVAGKSSLVPDNTTGLDDRWQMEEETASVFSNTHVANMAATRVSSQVHASPSYDPRYTPIHTPFCTPWIIPVHFASVRLSQRWPYTRKAG